jgi:tetratricopeptide (TPR) repeat protein
MKKLLFLLSFVFLWQASGLAQSPRESYISAPDGVSGTSLDEFDTLLVEAFKLYQSQKWQELIAMCEQLAKLRPDDNRPYTFSGAAHMALWKMEEASALFALAIRFSPRNPVLHYSKARADRYRDAKDEGLISIRKAIELRPSYAEAYLLLGDLLTNDVERAAAFRKAIEIDPKLLDAYKYLGMQLEGRKDEKGAEEAYRTAMEIDPAKMAGLFDLGRLLVKQERLKEARELWNKRTSDEYRTFPNFITVLERAEKLEAAKKAYENNPNDPEVILGMGLATMDGDHWVVDSRWERALVFFRKALKIKPGLARAQHAICKAYVEMADLNKSKNKELDEELAKLRNMDAKLADEIVEYRRTYSSGLKALGPPPPAKKP